MARHRKMAGMSTGTVLLVAGGGIVLIYMLMKNQSTAPLPPPIYPGINPATAALQAQASTTNSEIQAGANTVNNLINSIFS